MTRRWILVYAILAIGLLLIVVAWESSPTPIRRGRIPQRLLRKALYRQVRRIR